MPRPDRIGRDSFHLQRDLVDVVVERRIIDVFTAEPLRISPVS